MNAKKTTTKARPATTKRSGRTPRREDIPGISPDLPDEANWQEAARALRVRPFYTGPGAVPFSRLRARLVPDPTKGNRPANDFYLNG